MVKEQLTTERNELYKEQFDMLSIGTTEYPYMAKFFENEIFPHLPAQGHFLDVGCGRGNYARPFSEYFTQTTVVEVNEVYFNEVTAWISAQGRNINGYNRDWLEVTLGDVQLDLVLMSHVLYYIDADKRSRFIRKAYDLLKPGGYQVIVLNSEGCGIRKVYKEFYPQDEYEAMPSGEAMAALLRDEGRYPHIEERIFPAEITVESHHAMEMLIDFLLLRQVPFETEAQIAHRSQYVKNNLLCDDGQYIMDSEGTMIILRKPS
ncbi:MAG: class I SAM-dependent methyltransferase [Anaerolineae bacterium]|nr:class I SAM-dependent methyltransferase [Anaerolineae bacterium]MDQ7034485.1 class I SAM-dependent methyltransferase [Anaerolineae bacterium]